MSDVRFMPHQLEAIGKLRSGSILCGGVGTGKSITALGYFYKVECEGVEWTDGKMRGPLLNARPLFIITTARKRDTHEWEEECDRFDFGDIEITIDSWNNLHKYEDVRGAFFIFDEQRVVGSGSWVKSFLKITNGNHWLLLSATPGDSWMDYIPVFLANGFYRNRSEFLRRHAVFNRFSKYPKVDRWLEVGYLEGLRRKITVTMKFDRKTVAHNEDVYVNYDEALYKTVLEDRWNPYEEQPIRDIAGACYLMRKVASLGQIEGMINHKPFKVNAKALDILNKVVSGHSKMIVFYNYDYELDAMKDTFATMKELGYCVGCSVSVAEWNGHKHEPIPASDYWIYLVQYTAGAEGWNCIETNAIAFFSQSYSYKIMTQAAGRIDRMNTSFVDLYYYTYRTNSSIDRAVAKALRGKKNFNEKLFGVSNGIDLPSKL